MLFATIKKRTRAAKIVKIGQIFGKIARKKGEIKDFPCILSHKEGKSKVSLGFQMPFGIQIEVVGLILANFDF